MPKKPKHVVAEHADLMKEWDYDKNNILNIDPRVVGEASHTKAWWKCKNGHSWLAMISNRVRHERGCPYCSHQLPVPGETDFASLYPELLKEWHPTKNTCNPTELMPGTHKKAWWKCEKGHEWQAEVKSRVSGVGCPYCANKIIIKGFNDLATINPELAKEWHPTKNGDLTPFDVSPSSGKKVWWKCKNGHVFYAQICNRNAGRGCPKCSDKLRTSFPEQAIYYYVKKVFPDAINAYKEIFKYTMELDIFIPSIQVGIEYDGKLFHSNQRNKIRDARKYSICKSHGIKLIRIFETTRYSPLIVCDHRIEIPDASDKYLNWAIYNLCAYLGKKVAPDVRKDRKHILEYLNVRKTSLSSDFPLIAKEWDYEGNYPLVPENFAPHSNERVFWKCRVCGHKWKAAIGDRTGEDNNGCPVCARKRGGVKRTIRRLKEQGSLAETHPQLLSEWNYEKNKDISPYEVIAGSTEKVSWVCNSCGFTWTASIVKRAKQGRGCPKCAIKRTITKRTEKKLLIQGSLADNHPELLDEWNYKENNNISPCKVTSGSNRMVSWVCRNCGVVWNARISERAKKGQGCPCCNHRIVVAGINDFATLCPDLLKEWDYQKNDELGITPQNVSKKSGKKVNWVCSICGYKWAASVASRSSGHGCPNFRKHKKQPQNILISLF